MTKIIGTLDDKDQKLVARLRDNARTPVSVLAREVNLSRTATVARLSRLGRDGILTGYTARVRSGADVALRAWLFVKLEAGKTCADVVGLLAARCELLQCHALAGEWDLLIEAATNDASEMSQLRDWTAGLPGVAVVTTQSVLVTHFDRSGG